MSVPVAVADWSTARVSTVPGLHGGSARAWATRLTSEDYDPMYGGLCPRERPDVRGGSDSVISQELR